MSHLTCPKCGSKDHISGYGLAAGPIGFYTFCDNCNVILEFTPDLEGVPEEAAKKILAEVEKQRIEVWGK